MCPKINNLSDLYFFVKDLHEQAWTPSNDVAKYINTEVYSSYGIGYAIPLSDSFIKTTMWSNAGVLNDVLRWYWVSLILPTQFRLINESTQGVLLRISIGMVYKLSIENEYKQIIYNDLINFYKETKFKSDAQYYKYNIAKLQYPHGEFTKKTYLPF